MSRVVDTTCGISSPWRKAIKESLDKANVKTAIEAKDRTKVNASTIFSAIKKMQIATPLYRETGGCHGAAIFDINGNLISVKEDIGRHNVLIRLLERCY